MAFLSHLTTFCIVALSTEFPESYNFLEIRALVMCEEAAIKQNH